MNTTQAIATFRQGTRKVITTKIPGRTRATRIQFYSGLCDNCGLTVRQHISGEFPSYHLGTDKIECES